MWAAVMGAFLISVFVLAVTSVFSLNERQTKAMRHIEVSKSAALTVARAMKFLVVKKRYFV